MNTSPEAMTFGDVRRMMIDTIMQLRGGQMEVGRAMAVAANMKVLNDNIQVEINAAKLSLQTEGRAHQFGNVVGMGRRRISDAGGEDTGALPA